MKKIFGIALVLAVLTTLCFGSVALAADPPEVTVNFNATNPDITVTAYKGPAGSYQWEGTAQFTLTGAGSATGTITAGFNGVFECYTDYTGQPTVYGGYTASDGDFQSTFSAYSYELDGPAYFGHGYWSAHSINATGVTDGSMTVNGGATAAHGSGGYFGGFVEGWQTYTGEAESVIVFGSKMDSTKQGINPLTWDPTKFTGAEFTATVTGGSPASFYGSTEAGTYPTGTETSPYQVLAKQGLGFNIQASSTISATLNTTYAYTVIATFVDQVVGETASWSGLPGYAPDP